MKAKFPIVKIILLIVVFVCSIMVINFINTRPMIDDFDKKIKLLEPAIFASDTLESDIYNSSYYIQGTGYVVFISICNTTSRATVITGTGESLRAAFDNAITDTRTFIRQNKYDAVWVKADIVNEMTKATWDELETSISHDSLFRKGVSLDLNFDSALLEAEINSNNIIDHDDYKIDLDALNNYLKAQKKGMINNNPPEIILFSTIGFICDDNKVYELYSDDLNYGRRKIDEVDKKTAKEVITSSSKFLSNLVGEEGKFIYGYYPTYDRELTSYNILRHAGTTWSMILQYKITKDETLLPIIDKTINYLLSNIKYKDNNTAYVIEKKDKEIKLGANGIAIIALIEYMDEFNNDKYSEVVNCLGNGILQLLNYETGQYYHVLNYPSYTEKEEYRTVYYDGEATFGLAKLYGFSKDKKWLEAAKSAVENFIKNDYTQYKDHWVAYAMNEITKYDLDERYFTFALRNVQVNLDSIYNQQTTYHTFLELLMASFDLYDRIIENDIKVSYLDEFDVQHFIETIYYRAQYMLNGYAYPEYVMYLANPSKILGSFFIRQDNFRVRIDDIQHNVDGYYYYYYYYDKLNNYANLDNSL